MVNGDFIYILLSDKIIDFTIVTFSKAFYFEKQITLLSITDSYCESLDSMNDLTELLLCKSVSSIESV